ncbi:glycosyltransferase involved in cell wall biosynthesis [Motilibacter rhizosphaerae]|uniref:Glycosyltransferase involved in cell wall biosynthesis n=2 Tax=Motilibacter rhizosphaerae TaxID=598652 RepID=A0A4Q7NQS6_9ACTN|nr:glycosyltransferase involved in cell wall biosynthesis [Motilibacter rhizosphaerae]
MLTNAIAPDKLGGLERVVRELSAQLVRAGVDVTVVTKQVDRAHPREEVGEDGVRIVRHPVPSKKNPLFAVQYPLAVAKGVRDELARFPDAVLHAHYAITGLPVSFGSRPYLYTFHAPVYKEMLSERQDSYALPGFVQRPAVASLRAAEARVVRKSQKAVVLSEFMRDELRQLDQSTGDGAAVIAGGIDVDWFSEGPRTRDAWAEQAQPLLFTARRFTARTGVAQLVQAMPAVLQRFPGARLAVAGDGRLRPEIEADIARLGLGESVRLLGRVSDEDLLRWYRNADLTVMPTQELEGFGLTTGESMACGTPVLVTPVGANPELVRDIHPALVAQAATPDAMAASIITLLSEPALLQELRPRVRDHAVGQWSWKVVLEKHRNLYAHIREVRS